MSDPEQLTRHWSAHYPWPPLAHTLKRRCPDRWFRIHTLPDSKRYGENESEYRTILDRHETMLDELFGPAGQMILITTGATFGDAPEQEPLACDPEARLWTSVAVHEHDVDVSNPTWWHLFYKPIRRSRGALDAVLRLVADDHIVNLMILSAAPPRLYHPYDGGADVLVESTAVRDKLRAKYSAWLSTHPSGC